MTRVVRTLTVFATLGALALPGTAANAACASGYPVSDKRLTNHLCDGVRPGMLLSVPSKRYGEMDCTAGFIFADQFGNKYTSVPGSCHLDYECLEDQVVELLPPPLDEIVEGVLPCVLPSDSEEESVYKSGTGPVVKDRDGVRVGRIVYAVNKNNIDFALIRIDAARKVDPSVPLYGGPTRLAAPGQLEQAYAYSAPVMDFEANARLGLINLSGSAIYHHTAAILATGVPYGTPVVSADGSGIGYHQGGWTIGLGYYTFPYGPALARTAIRTKLNLRLQTAKVVA